MKSCLLNDSESPTRRKTMVKVTREIHGKETTIEGESALSVVQVLFAIDGDLSDAYHERVVEDGREFDWGALDDGN
jgi:hypothetical protein